MLKLWYSSLTSFAGRAVCSVFAAHLRALRNATLVVGHHPLLIHSGVLHQLLGGKPVGNLSLGRLGAVGSVNDVASNLHAQVAADGAGGGVQGVGGAHQHAPALDAIGALPNHGHDGPRGEELHQAAEEGLGGEVGVVGGGLGLTGVHHLQANQLPALGLEALDNLANLLALHGVGLAGDEGALLGGAGHAGVGAGGGLAGDRGGRPRSGGSGSHSSSSNSSSTVNKIGFQNVCVQLAKKQLQNRCSTCGKWFAETIALKTKSTSRTLGLCKSGAKIKHATSIAFAHVTHLHLRHADGCLARRRVAQHGGDTQGCADKISTHGLAYACK